MVQVNNEDFAKPWRPGIYPKSTTVIYNNQLWILNDEITGLYTSYDFEAEALAGDWIGKFMTDEDVSELIVQTITDDDTTHVPSSDAVYDALALKADDALVVHKAGIETITGEKTVTTNINLDSLTFDTTPTSSIIEARMLWDDNKGTAKLMLKGGNVEYELGRQLVTRGINKQGSNLLSSNYQAVYVFGGQGNDVTYKLAQSNSVTTSKSVIGLVAENTTNNTQGFVIARGSVRNINTTGSLQGETWIDGDVLYLSPTVAGGLTNIKPISPNHLVKMGVVTNAHITQGSIYVLVNESDLLDDLNNVLLTGTTNRQILSYESSSQLWKNRTIDSTDITNASGVLTSRVLNINGNDYDLSADREWRVAQADTGVLDFAGLTYNSTTTINIGAVKGYVIDNESDSLNPIYTYVNYPGGTNITVSTLGSGIGSSVLLQPDGFGGGTPVFMNNLPTSAQRKTMLWLGKVGHPTGIIATPTAVINEPDYITSPQAFSRDLFQVLGPYINDGVLAYANGANLQINITGGNIHGNGINFHNSKTTPNEIATGPSTPLSFLYRTQTGAGGGLVNTITPNSYDVGGVVTTIGGGSNNSTLQYIFCVPGSGFIIQYGQIVYANLATAIAAVSRESFVIYPNLPGNAILIGVIALVRTATALNDITQAQFFPADKLGQIIGATSGISTGTRQTSYNNSLTPQTIVSDTLGADTWRSGRALNSSDVFKIQNIAGTDTFRINGNGDVNASGLLYLDGDTVDVRTQLGTKMTVFYKDNVQSSTITGVTTETIVSSVLIPANTFASGSTIALRYILSKTGAAGTSVVRLYTNTALSLTTPLPSIIGSVSGSAAQLYLPIKRTIGIRSTNNTFTLQANSANDETVNTVAGAIVNFNPTVNNYFFLAVTPGSALDSYNCESVLIIGNK